MSTEFDGCTPRLSPFYWGQARLYVTWSRLINNDGRLDGTGERVSISLNCFECSHTTPCCTDYQNKSIFLPTSSAMFMNAVALSLSGSLTIVGFPLSASSQILLCNGISPKKSMPCTSQAFVTPEFPPNICVLLLQWGQVNSDMFWTIPRMGVLIVLNILIPFTASLRAISWGVETMIAPRSH